MSDGKGKEVALVASSFGKSKNKKGNKKKKTSTLGPSSRIAKNQSKKNKKAEVVADKRKCFHCQKDEH